MPNTTTAPEPIPIRLKTTCTIVNVDVDIPRIMTRLLFAAATRSRYKSTVGAGLTSLLPLVLDYLS